jgi:hypothetical protein
MADPFDIPDVAGFEEDEEEAFDGEIPDVSESVAAAVPGESDLDALTQGSMGPEDYAVLNGLLANNAGELGNLGLKTGIPQAIARAVGPSHELDGMPPVYADQQADPDMEALYALAEEQPGGTTAKTLGQVTTGVLSGGAGSPAITGGALGAVSAGGETSWDDPLAVLLGGGVGTALGAAGGLISKGVGKAQQWLGSPSNPMAQGLSTTFPTRAEELLSGAGVDPVQALSKPWEKLAAPLLQRGAVHAAQAVPAGLGTAVGGGAAALGGGAAGAAYATYPTLAWGIQSVLSSGSSGLPPDAEQQLAEAMVSGDDSKVIATNFKMQQRYPAYAKRLQDDLTSLNEES